MRGSGVPAARMGAGSSHGCRQLAWVLADPVLQSGSERDVGGLGDSQDGLVAGEPFPGGADGVDLVAILRGVRVVDDEQLGAEALGGGLGFALPLAVDVDDAEAVR